MGSVAWCRVTGRLADSTAALGSLQSTEAVHTHKESPHCLQGRLLACVRADQGGVVSVTRMQKKRAPFWSWDDGAGARGAGGSFAREGSELSPEGKDTSGWNEWARDLFGAKGAWREVVRLRLRRQGRLTQGW